MGEFLGVAVDSREVKEDGDEMKAERRADEKERISLLGLDLVMEGQSVGSRRVHLVHVWKIFSCCVRMRDMYL